MPEPGDTSPASASPASATWRASATSIGLFLATLVCVFWVYGTQWMGGSPFTDRQVALGSAKFAGGLMLLLLAHEMGHYVVARAHGFRLSLPYFLPVPFAFGTFGAIIRLKSLPRTRTGLLEMGAAGPLAGFVVAILLVAVGLTGTIEQPTLELVVPSAEALSQLLAPPPPQDPGLLDRLMAVPPLAWLVPPAGTWQVLILANPPLMDLLGILLNGQAPGRYAELDPLAMAGWVGCLVTAINLVPIGQLDGGHVFNALSPRHALRLSRFGVGVALLAGMLWPGWAFWGLLLMAMGVWRSLPVPLHPQPSRRARVVAVLALATFGLCFMPRPVEVENVPLDQIRFVTPDGEPLVAPALP